MSQAIDPDLLQTIRDVLAAHAPAPTPGRLSRATVDLDRAAWDQLDQLGLARLTGPEANGGSGADWQTAAALLACAAEAGVRLPLAEHDLLAGWLADRLGLGALQGVTTVAVADADDASLATDTPWASQADTVFLLGPVSGTWRLTSAVPADLDITPGRNLAGEPRDLVRIDLARQVDGAPVDPVLVEGLLLRGALARAVQTAGALERIQALTLAHVSSRTQFGRTLSRFQAVQHQLADLAAETALARSAVDAAVAALDDGKSGTGLLVAVARSCAGHAATTVVRVAHQLHGAIGTTQEHDLHRFTLPALAWRSEFGSTASWDARVGAGARGRTPAEIWAAVAC